jgi:hypothetical protein
LEKRINTPLKYQFPRFERLHWYACKHFTHKLKIKNDKEESFDLKMLSQLIELKNTLNYWYNNNKSDEEGDDNLNYAKLLKHFNRELSRNKVYFI